MRSSVKQAGLLPIAITFFLLFVTADVVPIPAAAAATTENELLDVKTEPGGGVRAVAHLIFPGKPELIQSMLTDYVHWPDLFEVRMRMTDLKIHDDVAMTDIRIEHALLPGERRLITESRTLPDGGLVTDLVGGDFKRYHRVWRLAPIDGGAKTRADFELVVWIDTLVPDWLVALGTRRELEAHFRIVKEKAAARSTSGK